MPKKNRNVSFSLWTQYHLSKLDGAKILDQTQLFFARDPKIKEHFEATSNRRIVQFGAGVGAFISKFVTTRQVVGYDYTAPAIEALTTSGIMARNVDLDETKNTSELVYQYLITEDLSAPADIFIIRTLEYIAPDACILLLFALMGQAKPGTSFYIETANSCDDESDELVILGHVAHVPTRFIASFFSPRTDFKFVEHHLLTREKEAGIEMDIEQLVVQKI